MILFPFGGTQALPVAVDALKSHGIPIADEPCGKVTDLLLPVPSFEVDGRVRGGEDLGAILSRLPREITVWGGNLTHPELAGYEKIDLLQDEVYVAENAHLTAQCALRLLLQLLPEELRRLPVLIIGWGRIGKCLGKILQSLGAEVAIAARKETDRAMLGALGYEALSIEELPVAVSRFSVIFNTAPTPILSREAAEKCVGIKIDLASRLGIAGEDVIWARGLPGKDLPKASGQLIAGTVLRLLKQEEGL